MFQTPVLLITFNRPNHTLKTLEAIKKKQPRYLYLFQDGPRSENKFDKTKCQKVQEIFNDLIDWDCELKTYFSDVNLGCGKGPASAITWFFENVVQGIILEDDSIPGGDFYEYAEILLNKYSNNNRIKAIGSMHIDGEHYGDGSYYFSMMNRTLCAWATWRRVWDEYDYYLNNVTEKEIINALKKYHVSLKEREYWVDRLKDIHIDRLGESSWDIQFWISIWLKNGIGICPNVNLSTNIGFDMEGTHTKSSNSKASNIEFDNILPIVHPTKVNVNRAADLNFHKLYHQPWEYGIGGLKRLPFRINTRLKKIFNHDGPWLNKQRTKLKSNIMI